MTEKALAATAARNEVFTAEGFLEFIGKIVKVRQKESSNQMAKLERRDYRMGYADGQADAFREMTLLLESYKWVGETKPSNELIDV